MKKRLSQAVIGELEERFRSGLAETVMWFEGQMAPYYFRVTTDSERVRHLELLHAMRGMQNVQLTMVDDSESQKLLVIGQPSPDALHEALFLLGDRDFHRIEIHTTKDRSLAIFAFVYGDEPLPDGFDLKSHHRDILEACCTGVSCVPRHVVERYLEAVDEGYLARSYPGRIARHVRAWMSLKDPEKVSVTAERTTDEVAGGRVTRVQFAGRIGRGEYIHLLARLLKRNRLGIERGYLDLVPAIQGGHEVLISTVYLSDAEGHSLPRRDLSRVIEEIQGLRRSFTDVLGALYDRTGYQHHQFEVLVAGIDFAAQVLHGEHSFLDVREVGRDAMVDRFDLCCRIADLVEAGFGPKPKSARVWNRMHQELLEEVRAVEDGGTATVLESVLRFVAAIRATNLFRGDRLGQSFQLDPEVLPGEAFPQRPYGVFYFHGNNGMGFQVRFRASARGGLRLLLPRTNEQLARVRNKLLREVYDLAWAQQLKNKDIPEGGSKCIALVRPGGDADRMVRQLIDSLLDLILPQERVPEVTGPHGRDRPEEFIFLGPDENMTPERIEWVAERARHRGLQHHLTLMSSKAGSGINHKEYGVTSEGVYTWIPHVLKTIGIGEDDRWTLKMTGGPDGDVGGNLIKILHREQRKRCRIVAIADGSGCAEDPKGLSWNELLRLVRRGAPIVEFNPAKLRHEAAHVTSAVDRVGEALRNNLHNAVRTDVFVPCGGRPYTIDDRNWSLFCDDAGLPSAKAMVEGANIFVSPEARRRLQQAGLLVIKDSSANKGGVITSSYEILAGLVTSEEEFTAIKDEYVHQVIAKLRDFVELEAAALFEAWRRRRGTALLSDLSQEFSEEINRLFDLFEPLVGELIEHPDYEHICLRELLAHCPQVMAEAYADRLVGQVPLAHRIALLTKRLSSGLLYYEGLTWCRNYIQESSAHDVLLAYIDAHEQIEDVFEQLADSDCLRGRTELVDTMILGSRREFVRRRLGSR